jgi:hypothetical protein
LSITKFNKNKFERAKKQLETCLKIDRNFTQARDALKRLQSSGQSNWHDWWFRDADNASCKNQISSISASLRFFPLILALLRVFLDTFVSERFVPERLALSSFTLERSAPDRFAPFKLAFSRLAPLRFALCRFALDRFALDRFASSNLASVSFPVKD